MTESAYFEKSSEQANKTEKITVSLDFDYKKCYPCDIVENQQNSNVTYRIYDYARIDKDGKPCELHIEKGVMASNLKTGEPRKIPTCSDDTRLLGSCEHFAVKEIKLSGSKTLVADKKAMKENPDSEMWKIFKTLSKVDGKTRDRNFKG